MYIVNDREPKALFNYFEGICRIPHGSGNEEKIAEHLMKFATENGLESLKDANNNVLIIRPATEGYEDHPALMIQGHTDMVCEADDGVAIDFTKDPLLLRYDGKYLTATGTTLGADDGVAVAMMMALLTDPTLKAPRIECLFTTEEETGLTGAASFDYSKITARRMLNLDTGGEVVIVSCAGGMRTQFSSDHKSTAVSGNILKCEITGLAGGHSGVDIHLGRANSNLLMLDLLKELSVHTPTHVLSMSGGSKDNAIPSKTKAVFYAENASEAQKIAAEWENKIKSGLIHDDAEFSLKTELEAVADYFGAERSFSERLIGLTDDIPKGIIKYNSEIGMVTTSLNYAIVDISSNHCDIRVSSRSSVSEQLDEMTEILATTAEKHGFDAFTDSRYEGWAYDENSPVRDEYVRAYRDVTGKDIPVMGIHAGLECGIIKLAVPDMDIIATGAVTIGEHTTKEALDLDSLALVYKTVKLLCERL